MRLPTLASVIVFSIVGTSLFAVPVHSQGFTRTSATLSKPISDSVPAPTTSKPQQTWREATPDDNELINARVHEGVLTVDGWVAKVHLNYDIRKEGFLYFFVPGVGTAIVSRVRMPGSEAIPDAFQGSTLAFTVGGHSFELTGLDKLTAGKKNKNLSGRMDAYVALDAGAAAIGKYPMMGFGGTTQAPYAWPLSGEPQQDSFAHFVQPPPMPASVLPRTRE